jgi:sec-independent protein translocase protein TatA
MANLIPLQFAMFGLPQGAELVLIAVVILVLFGPKKIPEFMRGLGKGVGELKKGMEESKRTFEEAVREEAEKPDDTAEPQKPSGKPVTKE